MENPNSVSRRDFMRCGVAAGTAVGAFAILGATAKGQGRVIKVGLVGCGARGNGALAQLVEAAQILNGALNLGIEIKVVAAADYFRYRAFVTAQKYGVARSRCFGAAGGYKQLLDSDVEIVLLATPAVFRPLHFESAVKAGKHVFMEKPGGVDPVGCRRLIAAGELAKEKGLMVVVGLQRRHTRGFIEAQAAVAEGAIGRIVAGRAASCIGLLGDRHPVGKLHLLKLMGSWLNWVQMSGDCIVDANIHELDVANWFVGGPPVSAVGFGGRARRRAGNLYDFFSVDFEYPGGVHIHGMCRQIDGCWSWAGLELVGEKGRTNCERGLRPSRPVVPSEIPQEGSGYQQEQTNMLYYLVKGKALNQARDLAYATATAMMGRISAYTGRRIYWRDVMEDPRREPDLYNLQLRPTAEDFEEGMVPLPEEGDIPLPGVPS